MERLGDLVKEVRRHLKPLERQADAARRHGGLTENLRAIRLHLTGRESTTLTERLAGLGEKRERFGAEEDVARERVARLEAEVAESEEALASLPADSLGEAVTAAEGLLARARGLGALVAEKRRNIDRSLAALADAGVVETLTAEAAALRADLASTSEEAEALAPRQAELDAIEETLEDRRAELQPAGELSARVAALESAREAHQAAEERAAAAEEARRAADGDVHRWSARAEALDAALGDL